MRVLQRDTSEQEKFSDQLKVKPQIPRKPSHLANVGKSKTVRHQPSRSDGLCEHFVKSNSRGWVKKYGVGLDCEKTASPLPSPMVMNTRRKSSSAILLSQPFCEIASNLNDKSTTSSRTSTTSRETVYEDGYVEINVPKVEPGTIIQMDKVTGRIKTIPNAGQKSPKEIKVPLRSAREESAVLRSKKRVSDPHQHEAMLQELRRSFRSNSLDSFTLPRTTVPLNVDENGYEVPLPFKMPTYLTFDSDAMTSSADETDAIETSRPAPAAVTKKKKKRRLARYKRKDTSNPTSGLVNSLSKTFVLRFPASKQESPKSETPPKRSWPEPVLESVKSESDTQEDTTAKPIKSFLSDRLRTAKSDGQLASKVNLSSDYVTSPNMTSFSSSDDEWTDDESDSSEEFDPESYYQQIDPPEFSDLLSDHDYEVIDYPELNSSSKKSKAVSRKKSMKSVMASVVSSRKRDKTNKPFDSTRSPTDIGKSPKLQRQNMQDMRPSTVAECTWETVSTPGILKLNDFKDFGRNKPTGAIVTEAY